MLLFEAAEQFKERLRIEDLKENIPEYFEAMEIAVKCIEAQYTIIEYLQSFYDEDEEKHKHDMYSRALVMEFLDSCRYDYDGEEVPFADVSETWREHSTANETVIALYQGMTDTMKRAVVNVMKEVQVKNGKKE